MKRIPLRTGYDLALLAVVLTLLAIGLAMVYSASGIKALDTLDEPRYYLIQQSAWVLVGLVAMFVVARIDYHRYRRLALPALAIAILLLIAVLIPGVGTRVGAVAALVVAEPDLGTAIVVGAIGLAMYFVAGARLREFGALGLLAVTAVAAAAVIQPYRLQRILTFLDPWSDPRGAGFQTIQSLYGLALGGPFGEGLGAGKEKFGFLPAPYTDSIFAVLGNELGLFGTLVVVLLFLMIAFKGVRIALRAPDATGALLAAGITTWIVFQAWVNMAVVASLVPMTGITLPFISYGGSSICVGLVGVGILLNIGRQGIPRAETKDASVPGAARGRRDGRTREPAPRGGRGAAGGRARNGDPVRRGATRSRG